ncbi:hypothetical protein Tco_0514929 [Tanacetum coccineum]
MAEAHRNEEQNQNSIESSDDDYNSSDCEEIENVDFQTKGDESVVIKDISTSDPFLNKICSARIMFRGTTEHIQTETPQVDPDENQIDVVNKVKSGVHYPAFDPDIPWDKMQPTLDIRYETPQQLKLALANYGVANGYQLWYMKNDWRDVLVYCGRNVEEERCAGKKSNKDRVMPNKVRSGVKKKVIKKQIVKKQTVKKTTVLDSGEGTSQQTKWTKKQIQDSKKVVCPFRMYASWMSNEHSFQIKSLIILNTNVVGITTWDLLLLYFFKEIIEDPFMPLRKIRAEIRQKFMIDVSLGQRRRAKQLALFDHEGGLIEHYGKLYQYRQALLDSNPGSTWCRKVIGLDGCFLKHTCRGELLTAMGRDANNQILNDENGITIISDSHKGLIDAVNDWGRGRGGSENEASVSGMGGIDEASGGGRGGTGGRGRRGRGMESSVGGEEVVVESGVWVKDTTDVTTEYVDEFPGIETSETTNVAEGIGSAMEEELPAPAVDKGKGVESVAQQDSAPKKKRGRPPSHVDLKGTGSTPDKAFDVSE